MSDGDKIKGGASSDHIFAKNQFSIFGEKIILSLFRNDYEFSRFFSFFHWYDVKIRVPR